MHIYANLHIMPMQQPFIVGKPVTGKYFIDRSTELKKITALLAGTSKGSINNIILLGLRRTGKSSILLNVKTRIDKDKKIVVVIFDAYGVSTKERFARSFMDAILDSYIEKTGNKEHKKKIKQLLAEGYDKVKNKLADFDIVIAEFVKFHVNLREIKTREDDILENALEYSERLGKEKGISFVLMIDEFQELLKWGEGFLKMFRRLVQSQSHVAYVFSGSAPTIMKEMVYDAKSPFYKQLVEVPVGPLPEKQVTSFVKSRLESVKISVPDGTLGLIYYLTKGLPDYVQRLGLQIYLNCLQEDTKTIKDSDVHKAYEEMLVQLDPDFSSLFATFSDLEKEILIALANGNASPVTIAAEIRKPLTTLPKTLTRLVNQDIVEKPQEGRYRIVDAIFSDWVARRHASSSV